ncbi:MAG: endonuclease III domain-containing protein, partial [Caldilineaceae bacterium]
MAGRPSRHVEQAGQPEPVSALLPTAGEQARAIDADLVAAFGEPHFEPGEDPLEMLLGTILSANTNDTNSGRAFARLKMLAAGDWDRVRTSPLEPIIEAIRPAGMYNQKAPHIIATLEQL